MSEKKYLLLSLDDERAKKLSEVLGSQTCKKIIDFLAETDASEKNISDGLKIPLNTVEYNLKKLLKAELVEKTKDFFWSQKGKKIPVYKLSNKSIIISPKSKISSKIKSILPVAIISGAFALLVRHVGNLTKNITLRDDVVYSTQTAAFETAKAAEEFLVSPPSPAWVWFLGGALLAILIFTLLNWRKI